MLNVHVQAVLVGGPCSGERVDLEYACATVRAFSPSGRIALYSFGATLDVNGLLVYRFREYQFDPLGPHNALDL